MVILKGWRVALPLKFKVWKEKDLLTLEGRVTFDQNCHYDHPGEEDDFDWNKLTGYAFNFFNSKKHSAMIGWRSGIENKLFHLGGYFHDQSYILGRSFSNAPIASFAETGDFLLQADFNEKTYRAASVGGEYVKNFTHSKNCCRMINGWFGGNVKNNKRRTYSLKTGKK